MAKAEKTKAERVAEIPIENISKLTNADRTLLEGYVKTLQEGYKRRVQAFKRQGLISHAQISLEGSISPKSAVQLTKMSRNQLILEFARYSKFFNSQTSTVSGIKKINREQDIRLFGKDSRGNPRYSMSQEERTLFWRLYDEYQNQNPDKFANYGYNRIQQAITEMVTGGRELTKDTLLSQMEELSDILEEAQLNENLRSVPGVYSGRGVDF